MNRITPDNIVDLPDGHIFVFGSNEGGYHSKFAAKTAMQWGAKYGQASGLMGRTYGIPTKGRSVRYVLPIERIERYVNEFIDFASTRRDLVFLVTKIGCGAAHYSPRDIAPLFAEAAFLENVHLPREFWDVINKK